MRVWLRTLNELETPLCRLLSHGSSQRWYLWRGFAIVSRLGNGVFWYGLIAGLALLDGLDGIRAGLHMLLTGGIGLGLYQILKRSTRRERPCNQDLAIVAGAPPLDRYSFPSGHTLHAVAFSTVALNYYPGLAWCLVPFTLLIGASRVVLGLHYPSDVLVASLLGLLLGYVSLAPVA